MPDVPAVPSEAQPVSQIPRIRIFVDFWNLQLTLNEREEKATGVAGAHFQLDWLKFMGCLCDKAQELLKTPKVACEEMTVYASYDSRTPSGRKFNQWATNWLDRQTGIEVKCFERKPKHPPRCPECHGTIETCPLCSKKMAGTTEKGVDTAIVTDMIRLAWEKAYDIGVIVSSDGDMVPAVKFLRLRGVRFIHAGFPPLGIDLARSCWGGVDLFALRSEYRRVVSAAPPAAPPPVPPACP
jgi:uncharacterized LabA/DUF88 family protein